MEWTWTGTPERDLHEALAAACTLIRPVLSYLEIGVDGGGSLNTVLCQGVPPRIVLCDIWNPEYCNHGDTKPHVQFVLEYFHTQAKFLDGDSKVLVPTLKEQFDLVLVDADHSAEGARADLQNAWPLVREGGILVMDDINHPNYPWLNGIWQEAIDKYSMHLIAEVTGGCNAALAMKPLGKEWT